jgi:predicted lipoprotein with Yx(FWY)xxD motif
MRRSVVRVLQLLLLVVLWAAAGHLSPAVLAQGPTVHPMERAGAAAGQYGPAYGPSAPAGAAAQSIAAPAAAAETGPTGLTPDDCAFYDSWCAYCTSHPDSDLCALFVPPHLVPLASPSPSSSTGPRLTPPPSASPSSSPSSGAAAPAGGPTVSVRQSSMYGAYLVDAQGMALYTLSADTPGVSTCTDACTRVWPPLLLASGNPAGGSGVTGTLAVITRSDGGRQVTYNGMPLYTYVRDMSPGDTTGANVTDTWGTWHLAKP